MSIATSYRVIHTPEELLSHARGKGFELVDGEFVTLHVGSLSSFLAVAFLRSLGNYCVETLLALTFASDLGYQLPGFPNTVRKPDVSVIRKERIYSGFWDEGYVAIAPDVAVEVVSLNDNANDVEVKVGEYLQAGVRLVWVVFSKTRTVMLRRIDGTASTLGINDEITGEEVLPGFQLKVSDIFSHVAP